MSLTTSLTEPSHSASTGYGPLFQRDYWSVIMNCRYEPQEVMKIVALKFSEFAPEELCRFRCQNRSSNEEAPPTGLKVGQVLDIEIAPALRCRVRVLHKDALSLTLGTLAGHPEAGRITFGAYRNDLGDVLFHIRSRARAGNGRFYAGFLLMGEAMQTQTWAEFVSRVAITTGDGPLKAVHAETTILESSDPSKEFESGPTYLAKSG